MSTKSTIASGDVFHIYDEVIDGGIYLELDTDDIKIDYSQYRKQARLRVRLPRELLDRLSLDGQPLMEHPGLIGEPFVDAMNEL